ncbi:MAG TPA: FtsX-like permease family protein [Solirubrobacteraceae bacterium]|jgi:putative ABC transport system permease protein|nr:FtsX-like permease family protein [Solirubrobacteraceae bacterium]
MRPANVLHLYRVRLRARFVQESLAIVGIAAGVALLFASSVASTSLQSSVTQLSRGIVGSATLQLVARDSNGFPEGMLRRVRRVSGVRAAAPILEAGALASGPGGAESVELVGADSSLSRLGGSLLRHTALSPFGGIGAVVLPAPLAQALGVTKFGEEARFQVAGRTEYLPLYAQLHERQIGPLISSPVALAPLQTVQEMAGLPARVSRILVAASAGSQARVRSGLIALAAGRLNVESTGYEERVFAQAAAASSQSTTIFSTISALVGFLFAFNATLLTVPQRRRLIADLRRDGYAPGTVIAVLIIDGLALGVVACALGVALGEELSIRLFHPEPAFLSLAFAVGSQRTVSVDSVAIAVGGGMFAALVAVLSPLRDILSRDPLAAIATREQSAGGLRAGRTALAGLLALAAATVLLLAAPDAAVPAMVLLVAALLLELPIALALTLALVRALARRIVSPVPHIAAMELSAARARAVAVTATGAVAVFGSVAIQGSHGDLLAGLDNAVRDTNAFTDVWVAPAGSYNLLKTTPFPPVQQASLGRLAGVRAVRLYRSGLLDYGERRTLVIAPSRASMPLLPAGQLVRGNPRQAEERVRAGGWLVLSQALASEQHLHVGETFTLPSPDPMSFRVAALSTNIGWAPGAIIMNAGDYARAWGSDDASAYNIMLARNVPPARAVREIERALGPSSGLAVQTSSQHAAQQRALDREALARLTQISTLIPIIAVLAMAAAMGAMVWQRRPRLAKLKLEGISRAELWRTTLLESLVLVSVGCLSGAIFGVYGQQLADRALVSVINFPVAHSLAPSTALWSLSLVPATALAILAVPGYLAASVPAALALQD